MNLNDKVSVKLTPKGRKVLVGEFTKYGVRYTPRTDGLNPAENHDYVALSVCGDCLQWVANDEVPDWLEGEND